MPWHDDLSGQQQRRKSEGLWRRTKPVSSPPGRTVTIDGETCLNFSSNNYLGLANDDRVCQSACDAIQKWGAGAGASHLVVGHNDLHRTLEDAICQFVGAERSILFSTGYMANLAVPTALLDRHSICIQDKLNHASLIDAAKMCDAKLRRYRHLDTLHAEQLLVRAGEKSSKKLLATDGVFSMDGDVAPLATLHSVCQTLDAMLLVDDAHGIGVLGNCGGGSLQAAGLKPQGNVLLLGTLSKACGSSGAFIAGDRVFIDELVQRARPFIYTTALPPASAAAALRSIDLIQSEPWRRSKLNDNIRHFRQLAAAHEIPLTGSTTPIQPIVLGSVSQTMGISQRLRAAGFLAIAIRPPTVPVDQSRLRLTITAEHTAADIEGLIRSLADSITGSK